MTQPVLLVEDDASITRFVQLALATLPATLHVAGSCAQARAELAQRTHALVLTDLTLPDGDGLRLIADMQRATPPLRRPARVAVFSARLGAATRRRSAELGVWRTLDKPVPLATLRACVVEALEAPGPAEPAPAGHPVEATSGRDAAIAYRFGGRADLYEAFLAASREQLHQDLVQGQAALERRDVAALGRMAHSLRSVLDLLGAQQAREAAQGLWDASTMDDVGRLQAAWLRLAVALADWENSLGPARA